MTIDVSTPWHKASYDTFLNERLPALLGERLPLLGYSVESTGVYTCRVTVTLGSTDDALDVAFDLPQPDERGIFEIGGQRRVVIPTASRPELDQAEIRCAGEQLYDVVAARLGHAPADLPWNSALARAWLPLDTWVAEFMAGTEGRFVTVQPVDGTNWFAHYTHLRRLLVPEAHDVIAPGQLGYVCPFEVPEGSNMGHVFTIAVGATVRDGRLVIVDERPEATLGLSASMIPLLEHDDPNRILMGANMLRQWIVQGMPEPAWVQTGNEPDALLAPDFWAGRNLLTAFVAWGPGTYEDAVIISESCARRFDTPYALRIGDKMSNRHGTKGVVGQILPDDRMPHLPDGTPVDLVFNFANLHRRMNFGQIREAVLGSVAKAEGTPAIVPPFGAPSADELHTRLVAAGLPESGMVTLTQGKDGPPLAAPSTAGWVYWGRLYHLAKDKLVTPVLTGERWGQRTGEMETFMLRDLGAFEIIRENLATQDVRWPAAGTLAERLAAGPVVQAPPPTPLLVDLADRLRVAGIETELGENGLAFRFAPPREGALKLARPVPHPWLPERRLTEIGDPGEREHVGGLRELLFSPGGWWEWAFALTAGRIQDREVLFPPGGWWEASDELPRLYRAVVEANDRVRRMLAAQTPKTLVDDATAQLERHVRVLFDALLTPVQLRLGARELFSARTVLAPAADLTLEQIGMPEEMAWALFGPLVARETGDEKAVPARSERASQALDTVMARSWVYINRAPTLTPTALLAFHPVRVSDDALHLHPALCRWLDADFDGDQAAVFLPITEAAQREAGERLSVAGHLMRDPGLLASLVPATGCALGAGEAEPRSGGAGGDLGDRREAGQHFRRLCHGCHPVRRSLRPASQGGGGGKCACSDAGCRTTDAARVRDG